MVKLIPIVCPKCGANLNVEEGRNVYFCSYCGTKILIDDNVQIVKHINIDEARIREAEANERIRMKEAEIEQEKLQLQMERKKSRGKTVKKIIKIILVSILTFFGVMCLAATQLSSGVSSTEALVTAAFFLIPDLLIILIM